MRHFFPRKRLGRIVAKGSLAIVDQGLVTGSNFLINIVLARWLAPDAYGAFAIAFSLLLLIGMLYQSLLLEPMGVFGASSYKNCFQHYFKALLGLHCLTSLFIAAVVCISAEVVLKAGATKTLVSALLGIGLMAPFILGFWLVKRAFYVQLSPAPSAVAALLYSVLTLGGLVWFYYHRWLSPFTALLLMGAGALVTSIPLFLHLKRTLALDSDTATFDGIWRRHWRYGRWALASSALSWVPVNIFYPLTSSFGGITRAGELKALVNLTAPVWQPVAALSTLLLPYVTRIQETKGSVAAGVLSRRITLAFMGGTLFYWSAVLLFRDSAFRLLYSGRYSQVAYLLPVVALGSILWSGFVGPANALRAMESPMSVFVAVACASVAAIGVGIPLTHLLGLHGAVWAMSVSQGIGFVVAFTLLRRNVRVYSSFGPLEATRAFTSDSNS